MAQKQARRITSRRGSGKGKSGANKKTQQTYSNSRQARQGKISIKSLPSRSQAARIRSLGAIRAMRKNPKLPLHRAANLHDTKPETVLKYFPDAFSFHDGRYRVTKSDRFVAYLNLPDEHGNIVTRKFRSSKDRLRANKFLADMNRFQRGKLPTLEKWQNVKLGGVGLLTDPRTIKVTEPVLSDFPLYRVFNGGAA